MSCVVAQVASILATGMRVATWGRPAVARAVTAGVLRAPHILKSSVQWVFYLGGLLRRNVGQPMRRARRRLKEKLGTEKDDPGPREGRRRLVRHATRRLQYEFSKDQVSLVVNR